MNKKISHFLTLSIFLLFLINCRDTSTENQTNTTEQQFPITADKITIINQTDAAGKKQGRWEELDTVNKRTLKLYYYRDDQLDGTFLEYKVGSSDTLILGNYKNGQKHGQWTYWNINANIKDSIKQYNLGNWEMTTKRAP